MDTDRLIRLFQLQGTLQERLGYQFGAMDGKALAEYVRLNVLALDHELHEALDELNWKPWAIAPMGFRDRHRYLEEIVDCTHFLINLCLAGNITAEELADAYEGKNKVNHERQDHGYTGLEKCAQCKRSLDDPLAVWESGRPELSLDRFCSAACVEAYEKSYI